MIPWFLIPGRWYPIHIYIYACNLYIKEPEIGQRGAAKATRTKFNLKNFSHSTVSRSFRAFEQNRKKRLSQRFGDELKICGTEIEDIVVAAKNDKTTKKGNNNESSKSVRHFPAVAATAPRKKGMAAFFKGFQGDPSGVSIEASGCKFVKDWYKKNRCLLL